MSRFFPTLAVVATLLSVSTSAFADKVAVLTFTSAGRATSTELEQARAATRQAVTTRSHTLPTDSELLTAQMSTRDGMADTRSEYRSAGRASGSQWTVAGHVDGRGDTYRLEIEVCQVESGRVESLVREVSPQVAAAQIGEMIDYLVRPEGLGATDIAWKVASPPPAARSQVVAPPAPPAPPAPEVPAGPPPVRHRYAEGAPIGIGLGVDALSALERPRDARGSGTSLGLHGAFTYALDGLPGLDLRAAVGFSLAGPRSARADAGARYMFPIAPTLRVFAGPEVGVGGFFTLGADQSARFLLHGAFVAAVGMGARAQIEVAGEVDYTPGGAGPLLLAGASLRGVVRF